MTTPVRIPGTAGDELAVNVSARAGVARFEIFDGMDDEVPEATIEVRLADLPPLVAAVAGHVPADNERAMTT